MTLAREFAHILEDWEKAINRLEQLEYEAAQAETNYRTQKAKAFLKASGPVGVREATATEASAGELLERDRSAAMVKLQRERLRLFQARWETMRTLNANERHLSGVG